MSTNQGMTKLLVNLFIYLLASCLVHDCDSSLIYVHIPPLGIALSLSLSLSFSLSLSLPLSPSPPPSLPLPASLQLTCGL